MSTLLLKKRPRFIQKDLLNEWFGRKPYSDYKIFEVQTPKFCYLGKFFETYTYMGDVLEVCMKNPKNEIAVYERSGGRCRVSIIPEGFKEDYIASLPRCRRNRKYLLLKLSLC